MALKLYDFAASICAQKVRLVLAEKDLPYAREEIDLGSGAQLSEAYLKINPNGVVPSLDHDDEIFTDASAICEYLDDAFPEKGLSPTDIRLRGHMRTWMRFFEEVTTPAVRWPSWQRVWFPVLQRAGGVAAVDLLAKSQPHHGHFYQTIGADGPPESLVANAVEDLRRSFVRVDDALSDDRTHLVGDGVSLADFILLPLVVRAEDVGHAALWDDLPKFTAWFETMQARPSFDAVFSPVGVRLRDLVAA